MSQDEETAEPRTDVERLIVDVFDTEDVVCTIASADRRFVAELMGRSRPSFRGDYWSVETPGWHIHARLSAIRRVRFVREPSDHFPGQESLSIRLEGASGESLLRAYFTRLYDDQNRPIAWRFDRWEALRSTYGGHDEAAVEHGALVGAAARRSTSR